MGYLSLIAECGQCRHLFTSNPDYVPSLRLDNGQQLVFCRQCVEAANPERVRRGLPPLHVHPLAYEPHEEEA